MGQVRVERQWLCLLYFWCSCVLNCVSSLLMTCSVSWPKFAPSWYTLKKILNTGQSLHVGMWGLTCCTQCTTPWSSPSSRRWDTGWHTGVIGHSNNLTSEWLEICSSTHLQSIFGDQFLQPRECADLGGYNADPSHGEVRGYLCLVDQWVTCEDGEDRGMVRLQLFTQCSPDYSPTGPKFPVKGVCVEVFWQEFQEWYPATVKRWSSEKKSWVLKWVAPFMKMFQCGMALFVILWQWNFSWKSLMLWTLYVTYVIAVGSSNSSVFSSSHLYGVHWLADIHHACVAV